MQPAAPPAPPGWQPYSRPAPPYGSQPAPQETDGFAVAALVCSFLIGLLGIIFGAITSIRLGKIPI